MFLKPKGNKFLSKLLKGDLPPILISHQNLLLRAAAWLSKTDKGPQTFLIHPHTCSQDIEILFTLFAKNRTQGVVLTPWVPPDYPQDSIISRNIPLTFFKFDFVRNEQNHPGLFFISLSYDTVSIKLSPAKPQESA